MAGGRKRSFAASNNIARKRKFGSTPSYTGSHLKVKKYFDMGLDPEIVSSHGRPIFGFQNKRVWVKSCQQCRKQYTQPVLWALFVFKSSYPFTESRLARNESTVEEGAPTVNSRSPWDSRETHTTFLADTIIILANAERERMSRWNLLLYRLFRKATSADIGTHSSIKQVHRRNPLKKSVFNSITYEAEL